MYEELKDEDVVNLVGGRFKLSTLIQKRMVQLVRGARPLVSTRSDDKMAIVLEEIRQGKIYLDMSSEIRSTDPSLDMMMRPEINYDDM